MGHKWKSNSTKWISGLCVCHLETIRMISATISSLLKSADFDANAVALNARKCHFMCLEKDAGNENFIFKGLVIEE